MREEHRNQVRILLGESNSQMRSLYRQALTGSGFSNVHEFSSLNGFDDDVVVYQPDILLADIDLPNGDICESVRGIRHGLIGNNPFLPVILLTFHSDRTTIRRAVDAGVDDVLLKPVSTRMLVERIEVIALARKPFVVTSDYIGPDRRKSTDRGDGGIPLIEPPNVLGAKLKGEKIDDAAIQEAMAQANSSVHQQRLRQSAFRIAFVAHQVVPAFMGGNVSDNTYRLLDDLIASAEEISRRVADTDLDHVSRICDQLLRSARQLASSRADFAKSDEGRKSLELLNTLGSAVLAFFNPEKQASQLAGEVADAVTRYRQRISHMVR